MKKILCAITSQIDSDIAEWKILNASKDFSDYQYCICEDLLLVINGSRTGNYRDNEKWKYDELAAKIADIVKNDSVAILFHGADNEDGDILTEKLKNRNNNLKIIGIESFSTVGDGKDIYENYIKPFIIEADRNKQKNKFDLLIEKIEKISPEDKANNARLLRAELLTPLVALDWLELMDEPKDENLKQKAMEEYKRRIDDMEFMKKWDELSLPKPDNYLPSGHDRLSQKELKTFADAIEVRIDQIQQ